MNYFRYFHELFFFSFNKMQSLRHDFLTLYLGIENVQTKGQKDHMKKNKP